MAASVNAALYSDSTYEGELNPSPGIDLRYGGQSGRMPAFGGYDDIGRFEEWQSAKPYLRRNVIIKLLTYPKAFDYLPNTDLLVYTLQAIMERQILTLDGLNSKLTVNFVEQALGTSNEVFQEVANVTRERSSLSFTIPEKEGRMVQRYIEFIIKMCYMDPDLKYPRITNYLDSEFDDTALYLPEMKTFSFMAIEPDILHRRATNAWLCMNCMFDNGGDNIGRKNQNNEGELVEHSIGLSSITLNNEIILAQADEMMKEMELSSVEYSDSFISPIEGIDEKLQGTGKAWEEYLESNA